jgi:hypothetical protein
MGKSSVGPALVGFLKLTSNSGHTLDIPLLLQQNPRAIAAPGLLHIGDLNSDGLGDLVYLLCRLSRHPRLGHCYQGHHPDRRWLPIPQVRGASSRWGSTKMVRLKPR